LSWFKREIKMSSVSFVRIPSFKNTAVGEGISRSLDLIDYSFLKKNLNIVIKPNLCYYWDHTTGQTTDVRFVAALIDIIREKIGSTVKISIVESDASAMKCKYAFRMLGYEQLSKEYNVRLINLTEEPGELESFTAGGQTFSFMIPNVIREANLKINIPKIKYSVDKLKITCALKNIYGCNPFEKKFIYHKQINEAIVALNKAMPFNLCIIDGTVVSGMAPCKFGLVMASIDPVAIDAASAIIAGINPRRIPYLNLAAKEGLGKLNFVSCGQDMKYFCERYPRKSARNKIMHKASDFLIFTGLNRKLGF
jgi:uncharacterized protein (DUF362 family)